MKQITIFSDTNLTQARKTGILLNYKCTNSSFIFTQNRYSYTDAEHAVGIERELVDALARESRLKARLQGLAGSVEAATKSSDEKYQLVQNTVDELKQTNM